MIRHSAEPMESMILSAHQPNYVPWLGYFYKIAQSDIFVILDDVQFTKNSYQNRARIKGPKGPLWLTQPVLQAGRHLQSTKDVEFDDRIAWRIKHLKTLEANYAKAAHASSILPACRDWLSEGSTHLEATNTQIIRSIVGMLGLRTRIVLSSTLEVELTKADRLIEICHKLDASTYLSGQGARAYQTEEQFLDRGIKLTYGDFKPQEYPQLWGEFCPGLSILDALFNLGVADTASIVQG